MSKLIYSVWLACALGPANKQGRKLLAAFGDDPAAVYSAGSYADLGLRETTEKRLLDKDLTRAIDIVGRCERSGITPVALGDPLYPSRLRMLGDRPYLLYMKGRLRQLGETPCVAIVGTRDAVPSGLKSTSFLSSGLSDYGVTVVSGLAYGIDSQAHRSCLDGGGFTVAVLGCGHERAWRWYNGEMLSEIAEKGMIISEYPPNFPAARYTYPQRNRIISGISDAVLVTQAGMKSGALITADCAKKQGRLIFVSPPVAGDEAYEGTAWLLRSGAQVAHSATDIAEKLSDRYELRNPDVERIKKYHAHEPVENERTDAGNAVHGTSGSRPEGAEPQAVERSGATECEAAVLDAVRKNEGITADGLVKLLGFSVSDTAKALTALEILGEITALPGQRFAAV